MTLDNVLRYHVRGKIVDNATTIYWWSEIMCLQLFTRLSTSAPLHPAPLLEKEGNKQLVQLLTAGPGSIINRGAPGMAQKDYKYKCKQKYKVLYGRSLLIDIAVFVKKSGS